MTFLENRKENYMKKWKIVALMIYTLFLICLILSVICKTTRLTKAVIRNSKSDEPISVSMYELIATPEKYHLKKVKVCGFLSFDKIDNTLFYSSETMTYSDFKSSLCIYKDDLKENIYNTMIKLHGKPVEITGVFNAEICGDWNSCSGSLTDIVVCEKSN